MRLHKRLTDSVGTPISPEVTIDILWDPHSFSEDDLRAMTADQWFEAKPIPSPDLKRVNE